MFRKRWFGRRQDGDRRRQRPARRERRGARRLPDPGQDVREEESGHHRQGEEYDWTGTTFAAELAGGTLPDEFGVPFTDSRTLAQNGQLADLTKYIKALPYFKKFNKNVLAVAEDSQGRVYGIPFSPYAMSISYNRDDFTKAGLDPNKPPTTWDEVESDAIAISKALPGVAGYMQMTAVTTAAGNSFPPHTRAAAASRPRPRTAR
ncbi:MAG: extracellular solute-binding protein [Galbitalea sp.]